MAREVSQNFRLFSGIGRLYIVIGWVFVVLVVVLAVISLNPPLVLGWVGKIVGAGESWTQTVNALSVYWASNFSFYIQIVITVGILLLGLWGAMQWFIVGYAIRLALHYGNTLHQQLQVLERMYTVLRVRG